MSLIRKNPNEILYPTGKKTLLTVIENEAAPSAVLWRVPYEDFNEGSKVIVGENEEALFYKNGVVVESFTGGEYKLETNNYPFLSRIRNFASGGISAYNCRIIYVNKTHQLDNKWGTDGPIQVIDNVYNMPVNLVARGAYTLKIDDAKKFYLKFAGSNASTLRAEDIANDMRAPINQKIKTVIAQVMAGLETEIVGISSRLESIAEMMRAPMESVFEEYGVRLVNFYIEAIEIIEDESYLILKNARSEAAARLVHARSIKSEVGILGDDYGRVKTAEIMRAAAENPGGSAGDGLGLGAGIAMGGVMGASAASVLTPLNAPPVHENQRGEPANNEDRFAPMPNQPKKIIAPCGHEVEEGVKFCPECGRPVALTCRRCGKEVPANAKFCPECGEAVR